MRFISHYPDSVILDVERMMENDELGAYLIKKYPKQHEIQNPKQLYQFTIAMKNRSMRQSSPLNKVSYNDRLDIIDNALGIHKQIARYHGGRLKAKREILVASLFKYGPEAFLRMIVAHELAHFKEHEHNRAFYNLCQHIEPDYHEIELDLRIYLIYLQLGHTLYEIKERW